MKKFVLMVLAIFVLGGCATMKKFGDSIGLDKVSNKISEINLPDIGGSSSKGNFRKATRLHDRAANRMAKVGENDEEVIKLYTQAIDEYKKCITVENKNTGKAFQFLGRVLYTGPRSLRDYEESLGYLYQALELQKDKAYIELCYDEIGTVLYRLGDFTSSYENYKKAAELSAYFAGGEAQMYWLGLGTEQDLSKAMQKYRAASLIGRDLWANIYALKYHIDETKKGNYYSEAIDLFLSHLHSKTLGEDKSVWMPLLIQSADLGCPPAQVDLWVIYRDNNETAKGMPYLQKALAAEFVPAYFHMGYAYHVGVGDIKADYNEAQKWYEKAAVEGFPIAQSNLGALYYSNQIKAAQGSNNQGMCWYWWNAAAKQGYGPAKYNITLVAQYQPPESDLDRIIRILNSIQTVMDSSMEIYNTVNKSRVASYVPPNPSAQQTASSASNSSQQTTLTASSASSAASTRAEASKNSKGQKCSRCGGDGKCHFSGIGLNDCRGGEISCYGCNGKGYSFVITSKKGDDGKRSCKSCNATGKKKCGTCNGSGKCGRCNGTGTIALEHLKEHFKERLSFKHQHTDKRV